MYESRRKGQLAPPPSSVKTERTPPRCQDEAPKGAEAPPGTEAATGPGEEERDGSSDSDSSSSEDEESWEPQRGKKQRRGPTSDDDGSFEVVPIEDPGESSAPSGIQRDWKLQCGELNSGFAPSFSSETSDSGP